MDCIEELEDLLYRPPGPLIVDVDEKELQDEKGQRFSLSRMHQNTGALGPQCTGNPNVS